MSFTGVILPIIISWSLVVLLVIFFFYRSNGFETFGQSVIVACRNIGRFILLIPYNCFAKHRCSKCGKYFLTKEGAERCDHNFNTYYSWDNYGTGYDDGFNGLSSRKLCPKCRGEMMYNGMRCKECNGRGWIPRF